MEFKSNARHGVLAENGSVFELKDSNLNISIHKYYGCGNLLFLSCKTLNISTRALNTEDFSDAVEIAKKVLEEEIKAITHAFELIKDDNEIKVVNY